MIDFQKLFEHLSKGKIIIEHFIDKRGMPYTIKASEKGWIIYYSDGHKQESEFVNDVHLNFDEAYNLLTDEVGELEPIILEKKE